MSRRANGEGSVYRCADGRWRAALSLPDGRRKTFRGATRREVREKLEAARDQLKKGVPPPDGRLKLDAWVERWLALKEPRLKPSTRVRYHQLLTGHVVPMLGRKSLVELQPEDVATLERSLLERGLSPQTVVHVHRVLHVLLADAVQYGHLVRNPVDLASPPRVPRAEMRALDAGEAARVRAACAEERLGTLFLLALATGMRLGELLALRWEDVRLDDPAPHLLVRRTLQRLPGYGRVEGEPKSATSRRRIDLAPALVAALRAHRQQQLAERLAAVTWPRPELVFASERGTPLEARNITGRVLKRLLRRAGVPPIRFHDLRHTCATLLLQEGATVHAVARMLGHADVGLVLQRYGHVTPQQEEALVTRMERLAGG
jgi:integrase